MLTCLGIESAVSDLQKNILQLDPVMQFKKLFVLKFAKRRLSKQEILPSLVSLEAWLSPQLHHAEDPELAISLLSLKAVEANDEVAIEKITAWCLYGLRGENSAINDWVSFSVAQKN